MKIFYQTTEEHPETLAAAGVIYLEGEPTNKEIDELVIDVYGVERGLDWIESGGGGWKVIPTPVSNRAKLVRVVIYDGAA